MAEIFINLADVTYTYFDKPVLQGVDWEIQAGQRIGLVGANGSGKSTLLRLLAGLDAPEAGSVTRRKGLTAGLLSQDAAREPARTVLEVALDADPEVSRLLRTLHEAEARLGDPTVAVNARRMDRALEEHGRLLAAYEAAGGLTLENRARAMLRQLGLGDETFDQPLAELSGGQAKLAGLARLLVWKPDLLLLDEPDNHLDLAGKARLEEAIRAYPGAVVVVSHDRYLLDQVAGRIAELQGGKITLWTGGYSAYAVSKQLADLRREQLFKAQQKRVAQIEAAIARFELAAKVVQDERAARQARARHKMLERLDRVERPTEQRRLKLELGGWRGSNKVLEATGVEKWFAGPDGDLQVVLDGLDLLVWHGERVGLVGPNGAGKSVFFRCILAAAGLGGEPAEGGTVRLGPSVRVGYYAQEPEAPSGGTEGLRFDRTLIEEVRDARPMHENEAVAFLGRFLFDYQAAHKTVAQLSGGERSRLQLARLVLSDANFLLLDEPTNNLDIPAAEALEAALEEFAGTVLVISHDRYFLDRIVDRVAGLEDGRLVEFAGGYSDYLEARGR
jgi:ATP-binding cassette subfamily F protein 3